MIPGWLFVALAFVLGAVPFGVVVARARGVNLREVGSGNIGATNAARAMGKKLGALVLLLDVLKGLGPTLAARLLLSPTDPHLDGWIGGTMVAAVLGHVFTPFLRFRGGKGVATGLGVVLAACPLAGLIGAVVYAGMYAAFRISSLGSLAGSLAAPIAMLLLGYPRPQWLAGLAVFAIVLCKHQENIRRLVRGEEGKV
jgi:acyl phosphate:glycerol-3-phosphate acyltransferase